MKYPLCDLLVGLVKEQVNQGNVPILVKKTGISKDWFYHISSNRLRNPTLKNVDTFLLAIDHSLLKNISAANDTPLEAKCG